MLGEKLIEKILKRDGLSLEKLEEILYLIFDYPHKHYTFKYFEV